jgi:DNA polymerase-1
MKSFSDTVKKGENFSTISIEDATFYASEDAWMVYLLYEAINKKMDLASLSHLNNVARTVGILSSMCLQEWRVLV